MERDLSAISMNLLRTLHVLLEERSVSGAATRLGVTPSAVSHALRQLRDAFEDPLLVRGQSGMVPTALAMRLYESLNPAIQAIEQALSHDMRFDPETSDRTFTIAAGDHMTAVVLQGLASRGGMPGPRLAIRVVPFDALHNPSDLESGAVDLVIGAELADTRGLRQRTLFTDEFACLIWRQHPDVKRKLDFELLQRLPRAVASRSHASFRILEARLIELGLEPRIALELPYFLLAPTLVIGSRMVLFAPRTLGVLFSLGYDLRVLPPPIELPSITEFGYWHERFDADPGHTWFRQMVWSCVNAFREKIAEVPEAMLGRWGEGEEVQRA